MAKMFLMCGISGSGKTTFAKKFAEDNNILYLGVDDFYKKRNGDECLHINTFDVWIDFYKAIHDAELLGVDCIVDTNALTTSQRDQFIEWFPTFEHHLIAIEASENLRKKNNLSRRRQVPDTVMDKMAKKYESPLPIYEREEWKTIRIILNIVNEFSEPIYVKGDKHDCN